jgi:hypothetical protein
MFFSFTKSENRRVEQVLLRGRGREEREEIGTKGSGEVVGKGMGG